MTQEKPPVQMPQFQAPDPSRKGLLGIKRPFAHQFSGWRGTVMGGALAAAMVIGYLAGQTGAPAPEPEIVSILSDPQGNASIFIEAYANRTVRILPIAPIDIPEGKSLVLRADGTVIGLLPGAIESRLQGMELPLPKEGVLYAITAEAPEEISKDDAASAALFSGVSVRPPK